MKKIIGIVAAVLLLLGTRALATSYAQPKNREILSPNGKYSLVINAKSGLHEVKNGSTNLWSFSRHVWHNDYFLSNDGKRVAWVVWRFVGVDDLKQPAVIVYSEKGTVLSKSYEEVSTPRKYRDREVGPIGDFWRVWRAKATQQGDVVTIQVEGDKPLVVDLSANIEKKVKQAPDTPQ